MIGDIDGLIIRGVWLFSVNSVGLMIVLFGRDVIFFDSLLI